MKKSLMVAALLAGCHVADRGAARFESSTPDPAAVAQDYQHLTLMTKQPVIVNRGVSAMCAAAVIVTPPPTMQASMRVFMNDSAADAIKTGTRQYPAGAVVVKEKNLSPTSRPAVRDAMRSSHDGLGGMIKHPTGYDPKNGDWEYFYEDADGKLVSGRINTCVGCHGGAVNDHIFAKWYHPTTPQ